MREIENGVDGVAPGVEMTRRMFAVRRQLREPIQKNIYELRNDVLGQLAVADDVAEKHALHLLMGDRSLQAGFSAGDKLFALQSAHRRQFHHDGFLLQLALPKGEK